MLVQLDDTDRQLLRQLQKTESAKRDYVKITVIIMLDRRKALDEVADLLGIDHTTVYRYAQSYRSLGLKGFLGDAYRGWWGRLDSQQLSQLYVVNQKWTDAGEKRREAFNHFGLAEKYDFSGV